MAEKDHLILTAIGPDHIGLVQKISKFITRHGCNIEDSKMAVFCGEFAVIVLISGDGPGLADISRQYHEIESETGLSVAIKAAAPKKVSEFFLPYKLTSSCMDHPGVVYQITGVLSTFGVNIEAMATKTYSAPVSGTPLFQLDASLSIPTRTNVNELRERLDQLQRDENIDIELAPLKT